ncbi:unnamed protein product, partial [Symbiodinium sp. KB8]
ELLVPPSLRSLQQPTSSLFLSGEGVSYQSPKLEIEDWSRVLYVVATSRVHDGCLAPLMQLEEQYYKKLEEEETRGNVFYRWHLSSDLRIQKVAELYRDFEGFATHMRVCHDLFVAAEPFRTCLSVEIFGDSETLRQMERWGLPIHKFCTRTIHP